MASNNADDRSAPDAESSPYAFHSRYDPLKEASRHVDAALGGKRPSVVFIIGGGLNYIGAVVAERFPWATRVSLQPCDIFEGREIDAPGLRWSPASGESLRSIISAAMSDNSMAAGVAVLEWPPVVRKFEAAAERIRGALRDALEAASADSATTSYWATRWLRNSVRFALAVSDESGMVPGDGPVVIACAGPGLEASLSDIRRARPSIALWALASAVPALLKAGLSPDLALSTDPGFWNGAHLRAPRYSGVPMAMPPSSYAPAETLRSARVLSLDTGLPFERIAIEAAGLSSERTAAAGSAAGSALALALRLTSGSVMLAGYDLAAFGLRDHASPYAFDILDETSSGRLSPTLSARAARVYEGYPSSAGPWRRSRAFSAYAATIGPPARDAYRVLRSGASPVEAGLRAGDIDELLARPGEPPACVPLVARPDRSGDASYAIHAALGELADRSLAQALEAIGAGAPIPYEATLCYKALAPREAAPFLTGAARGEATETEAARVDMAARAAARAIALGEAC